MVNYTVCVCVGACVCEQMDRNKDACCLDILCH